MRPGSVHYMAMPITEVIQVIVSFSNFTVTEPSVFASHTLHVSRWSPMSSMHNEIIRPSEVKWSEVNGLMVPTCSCSLVYRDIYNIFEVGADFSQGRKCLTPNALNPLTDLWRLIDRDGMKKGV